MTFKFSKFVITKEWLEEKYVKEALPKEEIAALIGCSKANIDKRLKNYGIKRGMGAMHRAGTKLVWNYGLTKDDDERLAKLSQDRMGEKNPMAGATPWNKDKTAEEDERIAAIAAKGKLRKASTETREKLRQAKLGKFGEESCHWKGGETTASGGYIQVTYGNKTTYKHRDVAEKYIKTTLSSDDHVHHIDHDKKNNDCSNLLVLKCADHIKLHHYVKSKNKSDQIDWLRASNIWFIEVKNED